MKLKSNIATSDNGFIFNPATGDSFTSNSTAVTVLTLMKAGKTAEAIINELVSLYEVERSQVERDWDDWMVQLQDANLLER